MLILPMILECSVRTIVGPPERGSGLSMVTVRRGNIVNVGESRSRFEAHRQPGSLWRPSVGGPFHVHECPQSWETESRVSTRSVWV